MIQTMKEKRYWQGSLPDKCDICHTKVIDLKVFIDGDTIIGRWKIMCRDCFAAHGVGIGTGCGQEYTLQLDGRWLKTRG